MFKLCSAQCPLRVHVTTGASYRPGHVSSMWPCISVPTQSNGPALPQQSHCTGRRGIGLAECDEYSFCFLSDCDGGPSPDTRDSFVGSLRPPSGPLDDTYALRQARVMPRELPPRATRSARLSRIVAHTADEGCGAFLEEPRACRDADA